MKQFLKRIYRFFAMLSENARMSILNIANNRLRSFLTILGIMIGVTAVIALITTISAVSTSISDSFTSMGAGQLTLSVSGSDLKPGLNKSNLDEILEAGDVVMTLAPTQVKATESGTVRGIFANPGDSIDVISARYGAVLYVEPDYVYTLSADTDNAYNLDENKFVHTGEIVYLTCSDNTNIKGTGVITSVSGSDYTVEVTEGAFGIGDSVNIFREASRYAKTRIGRGTVSRVNPTAYTDSGSVSCILVKEGQHVEAGDVLFETLSGTFDGYYYTGSTVVSSVSGIIESINASSGASINKGDTVMTIYPDDCMYIEFTVNEMDLSGVQEGDTVEIEFLWNEGEGQRVKGEVTFISLISNQGSADYTARASFEADENIRLGMTATVYTISENEADEE